MICFGEMTHTVREKADIFAETLLLLLWLYIPLLDLGRFFSFKILYTVGRPPWRGISPSQGLYLHIEHQTQNKHTQDIHALIGIRTQVPALERMNTVYVLDHATTVIGFQKRYKHQIAWSSSPVFLCSSTLVQVEHGDVLEEKYFFAFTDALSL
jgi:hypothetical protein